MESFSNFHLFLWLVLIIKHFPLRKDCFSKIKIFINNLSGILMNYNKKTKKELIIEINKLKHDILIKDSSSKFSETLIPNSNNYSTKLKEFENELLNLSFQLNIIPDSEIPEAINVALGRIGLFLSADRAYVFELDITENTMSNTREWCNDGIIPEIENLQNIPCEIFPNWMKKLQSKEVVLIPDVEKLGDGWQAEKDILTLQNIKSLIVIPIFNENKLIGFFGLDSVINRREYVDSEISVLKIWSSILASFIQNYRKSVFLNQARENYETFFNTINDFLFVLDNQGNIIHCNDTVINRLGYSFEELYEKSILLVHPEERREEAGKIVLEMLQGLSEFCPVPIVTKDGMQIPVETRVSRGTWDGQPAIFGVTKDISKIKLSEEKFSKIFYINPSACGLSEVDTHKYIEVNQAFNNLLGYEKDEVIGRSSIELGILTMEKILSVLDKADSEGSVYNAEVEIKAKNGELKNVLLSAENIFVQNKKYRFTVVHDLTEIRLAVKAEVKAKNEIIKQEALITSILDSVPDIIFFKDLEGVYLGCNSPFEELVGKKKLEIIGKTDYDLFTAEVAELFRLNDNLMLKGKQSRHNEECITYPNGKKIIVDTLKTPYRGKDGNIIGSIGISRDISERIMFEQALVKNEEEVRNILKKEKELNILKSQFISTVSHEFRTPLAGILSTAQLIKLNYGKWDEEKRETMFKRIFDAVFQTKTLLDSVSIINKDEGNKIKLKPVLLNFKELLLTIIDENKQVYGLDFRVNISFELERTEYLFDAEAIRHVFGNIISNAMKYSDKRNEIVFKVFEDFRWVNVEITDFGLGISPEDIKQLFKPFYRGKNVDNIHGTGFGLAIVERFVDMLDGKIEITSEVNKGTKVLVQLPNIKFECNE